eukprot:1781393-Rhodomonas_salina.4
MQRNTAFAGSPTSRTNEESVVRRGTCASHIAAGTPRGGAGDDALERELEVPCQQVPERRTQHISTADKDEHRRRGDEGPRALGW